MRIKITKYVSIAALLLAAVFWNVAATYQLALNVIVSMGAGVVMVQAAQARKYRWAAGFAFIALLFNPVAPLFPLAGLSLMLVLLSIIPFAVSLAVLKSQPLLSMPSITDRNPGSQSL
ncbi:MAG: DUF6804 family protein [Bryobacteraceae bacterium]